MEDIEYVEPRQELTKTSGSLTPQPLEFNEEQNILIKRMCQAEGLDDNEFQIFLHICKRRRLDPILRQIYATKRNKKIKEGNTEKWVKILVPIVAIEGLTATADRTGTYAPSEKEPKVVFAKPGDKIPVSVTVWMKKYSHGDWHEFAFTAYYNEFVQDTDLWRKMPVHMLTKCARAGALRMGWPEDCGGLYIEEEWPQTDESVVRKERERGAIKSLKESKQPNRGHGEEQIVDNKTPLDDYRTSIVDAVVKTKGDKKWMQIKVRGGNANVWNKTRVMYMKEEIPLTTLYCWHQSLFDAIMLKPQNVMLKVENKPSSKFSPIIVDILEVNGIRYEKGKPYVEPETGKIEDIDTGEVSCKIRRDDSLIELSNILDKIWPATNVEHKPIRNAVGKMLFNLERKDQLTDLTYPQSTIDAAIIALKNYEKSDYKPMTETGIVNIVFNMFNEAKQEISTGQQDLPIDKPKQSV